MTHGWPGSVVELLETIGPLTDPTAHGGLRVLRRAGRARLGPQSPPSAEERAALDELAEFNATGAGYFVEQATRPETIGYALLDSPIALAAWMIDHDTDSYQKIARSFTGGQPSGNLTPEHIIDNITLYWLTGTGASAARSYWEEGQENARAAGQDHLLQRGGQGWSLRRLGGTGTLLGRVARRLPPAALADTRELARRHLHNR
jgi:hypothetical protein